MQFTKRKIDIPSDHIERAWCIQAYKILTMILTVFCNNLLKANRKVVSYLVALKKMFPKLKAVTETMMFKSTPFPTTFWVSEHQLCAPKNICSFLTLDRKILFLKKNFINVILNDCAQRAQNILNVNNSRRTSEKPCKEILDDHYPAHSPLRANTFLGDTGCLF